MEKTFSKIEISVIKSAAKNAAPYVAKKQKLETQIKEVEEKVAEQIRKRADEKIQKIKLEMAGYQSIIDSLNASVKQITGGYTTEDLVDIKKEATGQVDQKTGKEIFKTVYALKYPETVIPTENCTSAPEAECPTHDGSDDPTDWEGNEEEVPAELLEEKAEVAAEMESVDPFENASEGDPFNQ